MTKQEPQVEVKIYDRPDMEYPVYSVAIDGSVFYIQRMEAMSPSETAWYEVEKTDKYWGHKGVKSWIDAYNIGDTKKRGSRILEKTVFG